MTRRLTLAVALTAFIALALLPGVASAQAGSPPAVAGVVIEQPAPVAAETLPRTGSDAIVMALGALGLLVVGTVLVVGARRRRADDSVRLA